MENSLRERLPGLINLKKAKDAVRGFGYKSCRDRHYLTIEWLINFKKETETALVHVLRIWDQNWHQNAVCLVRTGDTDILIGFSELHPMVIN